MSNGNMNVAINVSAIGMYQIGRTWFAVAKFGISADPDQECLRSRGATRREAVLKLLEYLESDEEAVR